MSLDAVLTQLLMGLTVGMNLVLVATGLTLVFGMMGVINFAHSALFMLGAYTGLVVHRLVGDFWLGLLVAPAVVGVVGAAVERLLLRPLRTRFPASHLLPLLLTFGLGLFLEGAAKVVWGADILSLSKPRLLEGAVQLGPITFPAYWLFALLAAVVLATLVWLLVERTPLGLTIRAATQDSPRWPPCSASTSHGSTRSSSRWARPSPPRRA